MVIGHSGCRHGNAEAEPKTRSMKLRHTWHFALFCMPELGVGAVGAPKVLSKLAYSAIWKV